MRAAVAVVAVALGLVLGASSPALASSVHLDHETGDLVYRAAPGERNRLVVRLHRDEPSRGHEFVHFTVEDSVLITAGPQCSADAARRAHLVRCYVDDPGGLRVIARLGNRDDRARVAGDLAIGATLAGGRGDDLLVGGPANDDLLGGPGSDDLRGGAGVDRLFASSYGVSRDVTADRLRGGRDSDLLMGSAGPNLIGPGPGVDVVRAGRGRDIVSARDDAIEQIDCGRGADTGVADGIDFPLGCDHHEPYSAASAVPLQVAAVTGASHVTLVLGCREAHPAPCSGTVRLELDDRPLTTERPFTFANRHRFGFVLDTLEPVPPDLGGLVVRVRAPDAAGTPADDRYTLGQLLLGDPFLGLRR